MKRWVLAALAALALPSVAGAAVKTSLGYSVSNAPFYRRVAVIVDDRDFQALSSTNKNSVIQSRNAGLGRFFEQLEEQGADIHYYTYSFMEGTQESHSATRWRRLGEQYPVAIVLQMRARFASGPLTHRKRYFRPESTSVHVIHVGGYGDTKQDDTAVAADSMLGTCSNSFSTFAVSSQRVPVTPSGSDSLPGLGVPASVRVSTLPTRVSQVVRLFNWGSQTDSVAADGDTLVWGWRVYTSPGATNHASYSTTPWMDYVPLSAPGDNTSSSHILMALVMRYTTIEPTRIGGPNWDDVGNWGGDPSFDGARPASHQFNYAVPRASWMDSVVTDWTVRRGAKPTFSGQADTTLAYFNGTATGVEAHRWLKRRPFVLHVHTHDSTGVFSNPFGRGANNIGDWPRGGGGDTSYTGAGPNFRVVGFRRQPDHSTAMLRWGIYNRIVTSDSLMKANGFRVAPWMDHAQNAYAPENLGIGSGATLMTIDSVMIAMGEAGKLYQRGYQDAQTVRNTLGSSQGGAAATTRIFSYPDEQYTYRSAADGKVKTVYCIGTTAITSSLSQAGGSSIADLVAAPNANIVVMRNSAQSALLEAMGLRCHPIRTLSPAVHFGETSTTQLQRNFGMGRSRVLYNHPRYFANSPNGTYVDVRWMEVAIFEPLDALARLAGRPVHLWVEPWEVYGAKR